MKQTELLASITKIIPHNKSLTEVISSVLDISYASAYRRTNNSAKITIEEAVKLAKHFNLSLDMVFSIDEKNMISVTQNQITRNIQEVEESFQKFSSFYEILSKSKDSATIYCAQDLHITNTYEYPELCKFKIFIWLKLLNPTFKNQTFNSFNVSPKLKKEYTKLGKLQKKIKTTEIWDVTIINSLLKQVLYYSSISQLSNNEAFKICEELKSTILYIRSITTPESNYKLYYNELVLMGNQLLIKTPSGYSLFVQHSTLNYFNTTDKNTCEQTSEYLDRLLQNCKLINMSTEKEKDFFFNKMLRKIDSLNNHLLSQRELDF